MLMKTFIALGLMAASVSAVDYCDSDALHCNGKHVACDNQLSDGGWGDSCEEPTLIEMTDEVKQKLLDIHNKYRNRIANGEIDHYDAASNMATMQWDPTLASFAELNVRTCKFEHDNCMNTEDFYPVGQNLAIQYTSPPQNIDRSADTIADLAAGWFKDEYENGQYYGWMKLIEDFNPGDTSQHEVLHFTQYVQAKAKYVGCAVSSSLMSGGQFRSELLACNYSFGNLIGNPVYLTGSPAGNCSTGANPNYTALCSEDEQYNS